jgi:hypothetical protein
MRDLGELEESAKAELPDRHRTPSAQTEPNVRWQQLVSSKITVGRRPEIMSFLLAHYCSATSFQTVDRIIIDPR